MNLTCNKNEYIWKSLINDRKWIFVWQPGGQYMAI